MNEKKTDYRARAEAITHHRESIEQEAIRNRPPVIPITMHAIDGDEQNVNVILDGKFGSIFPKQSVEGVVYLLQEARK